LFRRGGERSFPLKPIVEEKEERREPKENREKEREKEK
jgi:hypothetical protein